MSIEVGQAREKNKVVNFAQREKSCCVFKLKTNFNKNFNHGNIYNSFLNIMYLVI